MEHDFVCPNCESKIGSLDKLKPDERVREKVEEYVKGQVEKNKLEGGEVEEVKKEEQEEETKVSYGLDVLYGSKAKQPWYQTVSDRIQISST